MRQVEPSIRLSYRHKVFSQVIHARGSSDRSLGIVNSDFLGTLRKRVDISYVFNHSLSNAQTLFEAQWPQAIVVVFYPFVDGAS